MKFSIINALQLTDHFEVRTFDVWADHLVKTLPVTCLHGSVVGIDAGYYLDRLLFPKQEPLLSALGGFPLGLEAYIIKELSNLQAAGLKPHFVFSGLDFGIKDKPFAQSIKSAHANATAFEIYERQLATDAIKHFEISGQSECDSGDFVSLRFDPK